MLGDRESKAQGPSAGRGDGRDPERPEAATGSSQPGDRSDGAPSATTNWGVLIQGVTLLVVLAWCISVLGIGVNFAHSFWEWLPIFAFGGAAPAIFLWQANRVLSPRREPRSLPSAKDKENELLEALAERGELTPITAAILPSQGRKTARHHDRSRET